MSWMANISYINIMLLRGSWLTEWCVNTNQGVCVRLDLKQGISTFYLAIKLGPQSISIYYDMYLWRFKPINKRLKIFTLRTILELKSVASSQTSTLSKYINWAYTKKSAFINYHKIQNVQSRWKLFFKKQKKKSLL